MAEIANLDGTAHVADAAVQKLQQAYAHGVQEADFLTQDEDRLGRYREIEEGIPVINTSINYMARGLVRLASIDDAVARAIVDEHTKGLANSDVKPTVADVNKLLVRNLSRNPSAVRVGRNRARMRDEARKRQRELNAQPPTHY